MPPTVKWNFLATDEFMKWIVKMLRTARRNRIMPDKITVISLIWMTMVAGMLTATVTLYQPSFQASKAGGPTVTARSQSPMHYYR